MRGIFGILFFSLLILSVSSTSTEGEESSDQTQYSSNFVSSQGDSEAQVSSTQETSFSADTQETSFSAETQETNFSEDNQETSFSSSTQEDESETEGSQYDESEDENAQVIFGMRSQIENAIRKFSPYFYFHHQERYFPSKAEDIVDWGKYSWDKISDENAIVHFEGPKGGQPFNSAAPVYVNVRYYGKGGRGGDQDEIWLTYVHSYNYNDCGPAVKITGKTFGKKVSTSVTACPIGLHHGDNEHVTVAISRSNPDKIKSIYLSQHSGGGWFSKDKLQWDGDHVRIFVSLGSHANYPTTGKNKYMTLYDKKSWAADLLVELVDSAAESLSKSVRWTPQPRWLSINGKPFDKLGMSEAEKKFVSLEGRFGSQIINSKTDDIIKTIMTITWPLRKVSSSIDNGVKKATKDIESELNPTASCGLGGKPWWGDDDRKEP